MNFTERIRSMTTERFLEAFFSLLALPVGTALFALGFAFLRADGTGGHGPDNGDGRRLLVSSIPLLIGGVGGLWKGGRWFRPVYVGALTLLWAAVGHFPPAPSESRYWALLIPVGVPIILAVALITIPVRKNNAGGA